jgi:hypothetical protein
LLLKSIWQKDDDIQFFIHLDAYSAVQRPIIKSAQAKEEMERNTHNQRQNKATSIILTIINMQQLHSHKPLSGENKIYVMIWNTIF